MNSALVRHWSIRHRQPLGRLPKRRRSFRRLASFAPNVVGPFLHNDPTPFEEVAALVGSLNAPDGVREGHFRDLTVYTLPSRVVRRPFECPS